MNMFIKRMVMPLPKIIADLAPRLAAEACRQTLEDGYAAMTIRSVAAACQVSAGTVYNYYPSKEALTAAFMLEDWRQCLAAIEAAAADAAGPQPVLKAMYDALQGFAALYRPLFRDALAAGVAGFSPRYHVLLRDQLAAPLRRFCPDGFTAEFIAEAMLTWSLADKPLGDIMAVLNKLF